MHRNQILAVWAFCKPRFIFILHVCTSDMMITEPKIVRDIILNLHILKKISLVLR